MKVVTWIIVAVVFFALGWFGHIHHEDIFASVKNAFSPAAQNGETETPDGTSDENNGVICAQVITSAINPETKEIREFPTPCDVPEGWDVIQNDIPGMDLQPI